MPKKYLLNSEWVKGSWQNCVMELIMTATWFAILTGLGEFALLALARLVLHRYVYYFESNLVWMSPVAYLMIFAIPTVFFIVLALLRPRIVFWPVVIAVYLSLSLFCLFLIYQALAWYAALLLAVGLAVQLTRIIVTHPNIFSSILHWVLGWSRLFRPRLKQVEAPFSSEGEKSNPLSITRREFLVGTATTLAALAGGATGLDKVEERFSFSKLPTAPLDAPNVLLVILDTVRAHNLSLYGYQRSTSPNLAIFAKNGVLFEQAIATAPWTLPSHASLFTARYPHELGVGYESSLGKTYPTLAEVFSANGYITAGFVSNIWYCSRESGLNRGFTHYEDIPLSLGQMVNSTSIGRSISTSDKIRRLTGYYEELGRKDAPEINDQFLKWLTKKNQRRPFFAFLNYFDAHEPYLPPSPYDSLFGGKQPRENPRHKDEWDWSTAQVQAELDAYDNSIAYLDHNFGLLFGELKKRGVLDNTLVIVASDHGEEFHEHGLMDHGFSLYWSSLHVLLMMSFPSRIPAKTIVRKPVSLHELPSTILDLVGIQEKSIFPVDSIRKYWEAGGAVKDSSEKIILSEVDFTPGYPDWYPISKGDLKSLFSDPFHYILNGDGREELYDIKADPWEQKNLAETDPFQDRLLRFRQVLKTYLSKP